MNSSEFPIQTFDDSRDYRDYSPAYRDYRDYRDCSYFYCCLVLGCYVYHLINEIEKKVLNFLGEFPYTYKIHDKFKSKFNVQSNVYKPFCLRLRSGLYLLRDSDGGAESPSSSGFRRQLIISCFSTGASFVSSFSASDPSFSASGCAATVSKIEYNLVK